MNIEFAGPFNDAKDDEDGEDYFIQINVDGTAAGKVFPELELVTLNPTFSDRVASIAEAVKEAFDFTPEIEIVD